MNFKKILLGVSASLFIAGTASAHVLDDAVEWNGHYYKMFEMEMKWEDAGEYCKSVGGHLATAETRDENEMLKKLILANEGSERYWLGASRNKKGLWRWITGKVFGDYFDWHKGRQRAWTAGGGDYLCLNRSFKGEWDNIKGKRELAFICEWEQDDRHNSRKNKRSAANPLPTNNETFRHIENKTVKNHIEAVVHLVNIERQKVGVKSIILYPDLVNGAKIRAKEISEYYSHTRPNRSACFTALKENYGWKGENIAAGYPSPEAVVQGWMNSEGHRKNMLNPNFKKIGVGYYRKPNSDMVHYWVQMFGD